MIRALLPMLLLIVLAAPAVGAPTLAPATISYQGILTDDNDVPLPDGRHAIQFSLYETATGGTAAWTSRVAANLENGLFHVLLGQEDPLTIPFDRPYWLGVTVDSDPTELTPRIELAASPYSLHAKDVEDGVVSSSKIADGSVVRSLNGLQDDVSLVAGPNVTITPSGNQLFIDATGGGGADGDWTVLGNNMYMAPSGAIGVGTTTPRKVGSAVRSLHLLDTWTPSVILEQTANFGAAYARWFLWPRDTDGALTFSLQNNSLLSSPGAQYLLIQDGGNVGVGDLSPASRLSVAGGSGNVSFTEGDFRVGSDTHRFKLGVTTLGAEAGDVRLQVMGGSERMILGTGGSDRVALVGQEVQIWDYTGLSTVRIAPELGGDKGGQIALFQPDGTQTFELDAEEGGTGGGAKAILKNGAGTTTLELDADQGLGNHGAIRLFNGVGIKTVELAAQETDDATQGSALKLYNDLGQVTIELDADHGSSNEGRVITNVLEITGGSDLSEQFHIGDSSRSAVPGFVVSIDPVHPGQLTVSDHAYDRRVAGIVSGAGGVRPGMLMGQTGSIADGEHPVALSGRVYCYADASGAPIEPGDLLTTSATPGHAMKVDDPLLASGSILGKAMTALPEGRGLVLVLVTLQ